MKSSTDAGEPISLTLTPDEALVLFEFLSRVLDNDHATRLLAIVEHDSELWALNGILCLLERELVAPLRPDYRARIGEARERLSAVNGGRWRRDKGDCA